MAQALEELVIVIPPATDAALDTDLIDDAIAKALAEPAMAELLPSSETIRIELSVGGEKTAIDVHPLAIDGLAVDRYCAGGWAAVNELEAALVQAIRGNITERGISFLRKLNDARRLLDQLASEVVIRIAADALAIAKKRIADVGTHLEAQDKRYGIVPVENEEDEGTGSGPGSDNTSPVNQNPEVEINGSETEATALADAVRSLVVAHRQIYWTRARERRNQSGGAEGAEGASGSDTSSRSDALDPEGEKRIAEVERAFVELCGQVTMGLRGHTIAPAVFALLLGRSVTIDEDPDNQKVWSKAYVYMRDARASLKQALPREYPFRNLRERLALSVAAGAAERPANTPDIPELRAMLWASERLRGYAYEPLDDEMILVELLKEHASNLKRIPDDGDSIEACFRYRVMVEVISARDIRDEITAMKIAAQRAPIVAVDRAAGIVGLLGLVIPPFQLPAKLLGLYSAAGNALYAMRELSDANQSIDSLAIGALLASDSARYALLVASRPSVGTILYQLLGDVLAFQVLGFAPRAVGTAVGAWFDLEAAAPSLVE